MEKASSRYGVSRYFLLTVLLSFFGWAFETTVVFVSTGRWYNQGFMTLPFCPIYGCTLLATYFLIGTPDERRGILKNTENRILRYALYFAIAFIVPSVSEILVGAFFDRTFHMSLWSYSSLPLNFRGYACVPVSLAWAGLIFAFMKFAFVPIKRLIGKIPDGFAGALALSVLFILLVDISLNFAWIIYR